MDTLFTHAAPLDGTAAARPLTSVLARRLVAAVAIAMLLPGAPRASANGMVSPAAPAPGRTNAAIEGWEFRQVGTERWYPAHVPGGVHTDLRANDLIPDPFYRDNEAKLQWIGKTDWEYRAHIRADAALLARDRVEIVFDGLDTYATVELNGREVLSADNMFRRWRVDAKAALREGDNLLHVLFRSPIDVALPLVKARGYELPASNDQGEKTSPYTRKAPYQYGWDWGPRFVTSGVWRPARVEAWDAARIDDLHVVQTSLSPAAATLTAHVTVVAARATEATVTVESPDAGVARASRRVALAPGANDVALDLAVSKPRLWWPNGLGEHPLYTVRARLAGGGADDERSKRVGLRTIELRRAKDAWGTSFELVVNGAPVFAKGANWIPADSFPERVTPARYRALLDGCRRANMNTLRVWGGGYYEDDAFYDLCDEMGLVVWQEFMFACSMYPADDTFLASVRAEAVDNVVRLRDHACIALWCGNNEIETAYRHWGWKDQLPASVGDDYHKLFDEVLPDVVAKYDAGRPYWPSSPHSEDYADPESQASGDTHYWGVWHAALPFADYEKQHSRFMAEYGFQSFPLEETVDAYTIPADRDIESPVMKAHQKHPRGNELIRTYMERDFPKPKDFESFLYASQVLQAEGIRLGAEHFRREMPRTMGSLFWQVDDCWPVASWSSVDYFGRWKALQFYARRFYAPLLVSAEERDGRVGVAVVSDRRQSVAATLRFRLLDVSGRVLSDTSREVTLAPLASVSVFDRPTADVLAAADRRSTYLRADLVVAGKLVSTSRAFFSPYKDLARPTPKIDVKVAGSPGEVHVSLASRTLARAVYLSIPGGDAVFEDNFFDLDAGETVEVVVRGRGLTPAAVRRELRVRSLGDAF